MSILSSTNSGSSNWINSIEKWCEEHNIHHYKLVPTIGNIPFMINVNRDVILCGYEDPKLPDFIVFNEIIGGNFIASYSRLTSMKGFPKKVGKNFDISFSNISSLEYAPKLINKDFVACGLPFNEQQIREKSEVTNNVYCK